MSCGCDNDPCNQILNENESVASQLNNLVTNLFGTLTKTISKGRAVWTQPCDAYDSIPAFARGADEGLICYLLRIFTDYFTPFKGTWSALVSYYKNDIVASSPYLYKALQDVPAGTLLSNATYWSLVLTAPAGAPGPTGPAGSGSAINYAQRTEVGDYVATDTDAVIFCDPAAPMTITLPAANAVDGKWYKIINRTGAHAVTVQRAGADTINGAVSVPLAFANEGLTFVNDNSTKWSAF